MDPVKLTAHQQVLQPRDDRRLERRRLEGKRSVSSPGPFSSLVSEARTSESDRIFTEEELAQMLERVWEEGALLVQKPTVDRLTRYKEAITAFVQAIVQMSYGTRTSQGILRKNGDRAVYTLVTVIDEKLDGLGRAILQGQKDPLEILRRTDELRGLLISLRL